MKSIKHALLGALLMSCAAFASADPTYTGTFFVDGQFLDGTQQGFDFGADGVGSGVSAGDTFVYDFLFNTPPPSAWFTFTINPDSAGAVTFSNAGLTAFGDPTALANYMVSVAADGSSVSGNGVLDSAIYDLQVAGTYNVADAGFSSAARSDLATVPEPMSLALIGAGLAGMGSLRRRKAAKAA